MKFEITVGPGLTNNAKLNRAFRKAAFMQTPEQHEEAIRKFTAEREKQFVKPGMTPAQIALGKKRAKAWAENYDEPNKVEEYWKNERTPRRDFSPSSSWIRSVSIVPSLKMMRITTDNGNTYSYSCSTDDAGKMVTSDSIGRFYNNWFKRGK